MIRARRNHGMRSRPVVFEILFRAEIYLRRGQHGKLHEQDSVHPPTAAASRVQGPRLNRPTRVEIETIAESAEFRIHAPKFVARSVSRRATMETIIGSKSNAYRRTGTDAPA